MSAFTDSAFSFIEQKITPIAGAAASHKHIMAIRDGFISAMPFMIVGSFLLVFAFPPFSAESQWGFARWWLSAAHQYQDEILTPFHMTMGIMSLYITAAIAYNLAQSYKLEPFMPAMLSLMAFLLIASPMKEGVLSAAYMGGTGIFCALLISIYCTELIRFLKIKEIGIRLPQQVPAKIKQSFDLLLPILIVVVTLYPLNLLLQHSLGMGMPALIMTLFQPLVSAADSLPAILLAVALAHILWFAGIHGAVIVSGMLQAFWLTNLAANQAALAAGAPPPHIFMEAFWTFFIVIGGSGATLGLVLLFIRSRSAHLRAIGRLSVIPSVFNINEPVIFGTPIVMNPTFFIPFVGAPLVNGTLAYFAVKMGLVGHIVSVVPWTAPAPIGAAWGVGWGGTAVLLVAVLLALSTLIYYPFFKVYEKQLLEQERAQEA
ncbi:PTS sugar transporter subunit IIC [Dongshaea marina]|uniref:PTS sugar transporter subunit IIC n=1 Tax=Dongshaea marina TaxID=2047966 RepID=UPI000D3E31A0|nr:PTS transporter subunit EIIC [Dongshaea marina]